MPSGLSKLARVTLAASIAASGAIAATAVTTTAAHAAASSTVGGQITRSEILSRAQYWFNQNPGLTYNQGATFPDSSGRYYRKDCSGYVSMAWHLGYSATTQSIATDESYEIPRSDLRPGDVLNSFYDHVLLFEKWDDPGHTTFSYYSFGSTPVKHIAGASINAAKFDSHPNGDYKARRYKNVVEDVSTSPSSLPSGTLVKSPNGASVKVIVNGAGLPVAGSDVAADGYDLSKIVQVDDGAFNALPTVPPPGTVVHDQAGGSSRYVVVGGAALFISGADWTADGYNTRADMGVPSSWLQGAINTGPATGLVVMDQSGTDAGRYVVVNGTAVHISAAEWTADGYNTQSLMGVPSDWLKAAIAKPMPNGTVLMDQSGTDPSRYVVVNGAAVHISASEWTADGYNLQSLMGVPGEWLNTTAKKTVPDGTLIKGQAGTDPSIYVMANNSALPMTSAEFTTVYANQPVLGVPEEWEAAEVARPLANGTLITDAAGTDSTVYVMAGGLAVPLTYADFTGYGYDKLPLRGVPGSWEQSAAAKSAPADGTLLQSSDGPTVWQVVNGGSKKAAAPGSYNAADVVKVPTALTAKLPTVA
ncbi:hypothetical protein [Kitasatospora sp. NPDC091276]|uniref:hypothetical protein n=1 Tax=Kitasatospora sp. NPDC091276 TaxID=3155300 RepID=UPI003439E121